MAIIVGDIHGNVEKVKAFLAYKPEEEHVALGDYLDSFFEPQTRQLEALQLLLDSKAVLLWGNHDLHYLFPIAPFISTGFQYGKEDHYFDIITSNKDRFKAAYAVDGWLLTHAGCHIRLAKHKTDAVQIAALLNKKMTEYLAHPSVMPEGIFAIGLGRGGNNRIGGVFWYDFKRESGLAPVKQIFGHTETPEPVVTESYIALDTTNNKTQCWLFDTAVNELVQLEISTAHNMHEEIIDGMRYRVVGNRKPLDDQPGLIAALPKDEQGEFLEYLMFKLVPFKGGYWPADYRQWKAGDGGMIKTDSKGRTWDTQEVRLDSIEFALECPKYAAFTPSKDDVEFFRLHRPERELEIRIKNNPRMRDLPVEEQAPFQEWMLGQTVPCIEGIAREDQDFFYEHDYRRWKAGLQNSDHDMSKVCRKELLDLRREVKSLLGRPKRENTWFAEYNFNPDDIYSMSDKDLCEKIEVFKELVKRLEDSESVEKDDL